MFLKYFKNKNNSIDTYIEPCYSLFIGNERGISVSIYTVKNKKELLKKMEQLEAGDCIQISRISEVAGNVREMLSLLQKITARGADFVSPEEEIDTRGEQKPGILALCKALSELERSEVREKQRDGIERAKEEGKYKGRKPIAVDDELFESVMESWQSGNITARQAMAQLDLKPNTFYRRIKERTEKEIKGYKEAEQEFRSEIKEAARRSRRDLDAMKKQVKAEAKELKKQAPET